MGTEEARQTLQTLEQLIAVAQWMGVSAPDQRAALYALKRRRTALRKLIEARRGLAALAVVPLAAWRGRTAFDPDAAAPPRAARKTRTTVAAL